MKRYLKKKLKGLSEEEKRKEIKKIAMKQLLAEVRADVLRSFREGKTNRGNSRSS